jgi:predicted nucleic acid-binding protein
MPGYVLDTSALLAMYYQEPGALEVLEIVGTGVGGEIHESATDLVDREPAPVYLPFMALMEIEYVVRQREGRYEADRASHLVRAWPLELKESSPIWRREAARVKSRYPLSLGDAWVAALALLQDARLVHRDAGFDTVEGLRSLRLPEK